MGKMILIQVLLPATIILSSCFSSRTGIYKTSSFYKINTPGTIAVDEKGNEITPRRDTARFFYIETKNSFDGVGEAILINGAYYLVSTKKVDSAKVYVGNSLPEDKPVVISARKKNKLWLIEVSGRKPEYDEKPNDYIELRISVVKDMIAFKRIVLRLNKHTELVPDLHY